MADSECDGISAASPRKIIKVAGDYISFLPDEILLLILSYIPTKLAITTSVLSKRWRHVWPETPSISMDSNRYCHRVLYPNSINETLKSFSASKISSFNLRIRKDIASSQIDSWIDFAMSKNAETLSLIFNDKYSFKDSFFANSSVKQLSLTMAFHDIIPTCIVSWTSLRSLSLFRCNVSDESMANILSDCPRLESLTLHLCWKLYNLDLSKSLRLTRLEIISDHYMRRPVTIVAPRVRYLSLRLEISQQPVILEDVFSLTEANLIIVDYLRCRFNMAGFGSLQHMVLKILPELRNINKLTIESNVLQVLTLAQLRGVRFPQFKIKDLTVETRVLRSVIPGLVRILWNSPGLKKITVRIVKGGVMQDKEVEEYLEKQGLMNPDQWLGLKYGVDADAKHVASFVELLLEHAKTLETMVLRLDGYFNATEYQKLLQMVPTVSSRNKKDVSFKITP